MKNLIAFLLIGFGFSCPVFAQVIDSPQIKTSNGVGTRHRDAQRHSFFQRHSVRTATCWRLALERAAAAKKLERRITY